MQHNHHVLKKLNFGPLTPSLGSGRGLRGNICYHVTAFDDFLQFDMQYDHVLKKLNFDLLTPTAGSGRVCAQIFATMLLHL